MQPRQKKRKHACLNNNLIKDEHKFIKNEPVFIKDEPIFIKDEPVFIKDEQTTDKYWFKNNQLNTNIDQIENDEKMFKLMFDPTFEQKYFAYCLKLPDIDMSSPIYDIIKKYEQHTMQQIIQQTLQQTIQQNDKQFKQFNKQFNKQQNEKPNEQQNEQQNEQPIKRQKNVYSKCYNYLTFEEAKCKIQSFNVQTLTEYYNLCKYELDLPQFPEITYYGQFNDWIDYLSLQCYDHLG